MPGGKKVVGGGSSGAATTATAAPSGVRRLETSEGASAQRDDEPEEEGEEDLRDGGIPFFVNRGGLPVDEATWERMWKHVAKIHPDGEKVAQRIRGATDLPKIPIPSVPTFQPSTPVPERLEAVQRYIRELQYPPQFEVMATIWLVQWSKDQVGLVFRQGWRSIRRVTPFYSPQECCSQGISVPGK